MRKIQKNKSEETASPGSDLGEKTVTWLAGEEKPGLMVFGWKWSRKMPSGVWKTTTA